MRKTGFLYAQARRLRNAKALDDKFLPTDRKNEESKIYSTRWSIRCFL